MLVGGLLLEANHETVFINKNDTKKLSKLSADGLYYIIVSQERIRQYFTLIGSIVEKVFTNPWFTGNISITADSNGIISISQTGWESVRLDIYKVS